MHTTGRKIRDFLSSLEKRYFELEAEEVSTREASVPALDKSVADFEQVVKEQLEDFRRGEKEEKCTRQEKERITSEIAEAKFHNLKAKAESTSSLATKIPLGTWKKLKTKLTS